MSFFHRSAPAANHARTAAQKAMAGVHWAYAAVAGAFLAASLWEAVKWAWQRYSYGDVVWTFAYASTAYVALLALHGLATMVSRGAKAALEASRRRREAGLPGLRRRVAGGVAWVALLPVRAVALVGRGAIFACAAAGRGVWAVSSAGAAAVAWPFAATGRTAGRWIEASRTRRRENARLAAEKRALRESQKAAEARRASEERERARQEAQAAQERARAAEAARAAENAERARRERELGLAAAARRENARREAEALRAAKALARAESLRRAGGKIFSIAAALGAAAVWAGRLPLAAAKGAVSALRNPGAWSSKAAVAGLFVAVAAYDLYVLKAAPRWAFQACVGATAALGVVALLSRKGPWARLRWNSARALAGAAAAAALFWAWHFGARLSVLSDRGAQAASWSFWGGMAAALAAYSAAFTDLAETWGGVARRAAGRAWAGLTRTRFSRERIRMSPWMRRQNAMSTRGMVRLWIAGYAALFVVAVVAAVPLLHQFGDARQPRSEAPVPRAQAETTASASVASASVAEKTAASDAEPAAPALAVVTRYLGCDPTGKICDNGPEVETLQRILKDGGFYDGAVDGTYSRAGVGAALDRLLLAKAPGRAWDKHRFHGLLAADQYRAMQKLYPDLFKAAADAPARR